MYLFFYLFFVETEIFCNFINNRTVTLDQFNAAFLNKSINIFQEKKKKTYPKVFNKMKTIKNLNIAIL